jgi:hypothetical protein
LNHSTPRTRITVAKANVSTLLIAVGWFHKPFVPGREACSEAQPACLRWLRATRSPRRRCSRRADEDFQIKTEIAAQNTCAQQPFAVAALNLLLQRSPLDCRIRAGCTEFRAARP